MSFGAALPQKKRKTTNRALPSLHLRTAHLSTDEQRRLQSAAARLDGLHAGGATSADATVFVSRTRAAPAAGYTGSWQIAVLDRGEPLPEWADDALPPDFDEEAALRRLETALRALRRLGTTVPAPALSLARELVFALDAEGCWAWINGSAAERLLGRSAAELVGAPFADISGSLSHHQSLAWAVRLLSGEPVGALDLVHRRPDGSRVPLRLAGFALHDANGRVTGALCVASELGAPLAQDLDGPVLSTLLDRAAEAILVVRAADAGIILSNETARRWLSPGGERLEGRNALEFGICGPTGIAARTEFHATIDALRHMHVPVLHSAVWLEIVGGHRIAADVSFTRHVTEGAEHVVVVLRDVTDRVDRDAELELTRFALDSTSEAYFRTNPEGRILDCNEAACHTLGWAHHELLELTAERLSPEGEPSALAMAIERLRAEEAGLVAGLLRRSDGTAVPVEVSAAIFHFNGAEHICAFVRDISQRLVAEQALRAQDEQHRTLVAAIPGVVYQARLQPDGACAFEFLSERSTEVLGIDPPPPGALLPVPLERVRAEDRPALIETLRRAALLPDRWTAEFRVLLEDGGSRWIRGESRAVRVDADGVSHWNGVFSDITDRKRLEAHVQVAANLAAVGTLAAGVAHEVNNPLSYVSGNLSYARDALEATSGTLGPRERQEVLRALREAADGARRVASIVSDLKAFSRVADQPAGPVEVSALLDVAFRMTATQLRHRARLVDARSACPPVLGQEGRLVQVLVNLIINALDAMPPQRAPENNSISVRTWSEGAEVLIEVADNGAGMSETTLQRAFDPFFTTKGPGGGLGLGLSVCHAIVQASGGELSVTSAPGEGTRVLVRLPVAARLATGNTPPPEAAGVVAVRRRVLFVDDDRLVLASMSRLLGREHEVVTLSSAREALERLRNADRFDVIVTDLMMPDLDGAEFYRTVGEEMPELLPRIYLTTGGAFTPAMQAFAREVSDRLLDKATDLPRLRDLIRTLG